MQKEYLIPTAILVGCTIIGAGVFFGLRSQPPSPVPSALPQASASAPSPQTGPAAQPPSVPGLGLAPAPVPPAVRQQVVDEMRKQLERQRPDLVKTCWTPFAQKQPEPPKAKYLFNSTFDSSGKEIARGISEVEGMERPEAGHCLRSRPMDLQVSPTGHYVGVEVEFFLP
ncbi:hypothetical protein [Chondromyces crocatus]|uniref:Uncharacterized protein n=1 Tax=Chondromyces crocatus TaxID=52 RepID=A0A0K1ESS2_CHOCO|nr:hypothetical protein [Chondromyces crocatus]AKT43849.1 uncharacterized protein CMC5_080860 [Chondromyces crocatus]